MNTAAVITIGDELMTGLRTDTNSTYIASRLFETGYETVSIRSVGDEPGRIKSALNAVAGIGVVIVTGGLGPTHDDITKKTIADFFQRELEFRDEVWEDIRRRFNRADIALSPSNRSQAEIPAGADVLPNRRGSAPGIHLRIANSRYFFLPGVPTEMRGLIEEEVLPRIRAEVSLSRRRSLTLRTFGIPESTLYDTVSGFFDRFPAVKLAFLPQSCGVDMRLIHMPEHSERQGDSDLISKAEAYLRDLIGDTIYGINDDTLASAVAEQLLSQDRTLATAESCTGGLVSHMLTNIPGSSRWFSRGYIVYSNEAKVSDLHIDPQILIEHGAVSEETAAALAEGVRSRSGAFAGLGVTGIAGPGGAVEEKPVGLVYIGYADSCGTHVMEYHSPRDREGNKLCFALSALNFLRLQLAAH